MVYHGNKEKLAEVRDQINEFRQAKKTASIVLITVYHIIVSDKWEKQPSYQDTSKFHFRAFFKREQWPLLVVDEVHRLTNPKCQLMSMLRRIQTGSRFLLTGTPVQNNMSEMWSLMNFLLPEIFDEPVSTRKMFFVFRMEFCLF